MVNYIRRSQPLSQKLQQLKPTKVTLNEPPNIIQYWAKAMFSPSEWKMKIQILCSPYAITTLSHRNWSLSRDVQCVKNVHFIHVVFIKSSLLPFLYLARPSCVSIVEPHLLFSCILHFICEHQRYFWNLFNFVSWNENVGLTICNTFCICTYPSLISCYTVP